MLGYGVTTSSAVANLASVFAFSFPSTLASWHALAPTEIVLWVHLPLVYPEVSSRCALVPTDHYGDMDLEVLEGF